VIPREKGEKRGIEKQDPWNQKGGGKGGISRSFHVTVIRKRGTVATGTGKKQYLFCRINRKRGKVRIRMELKESPEPKKRKKGGHVGKKGKGMAARGGVWGKMSPGTIDSRGSACQGGRSDKKKKKRKAIPAKKGESQIHPNFESKTANAKFEKSVGVSRFVSAEGIVEQRTPRSS